MKYGVHVVSIKYGDLKVKTVIMLTYILTS